LINPAQVLDPLQAKFSYLADEIAIVRKRFRPFNLQALVARKGLLDGGRTAIRLPIRRIHPEAHAKKDILITRGGKHFRVARKILIAGRSIAPEFDLLFQAIRNARGIAVIDPEPRVLAPAEDIVKLEEIDDPIPAILRGRVKTFCDNVHCLARRRQHCADHFRG